MDRFIVGTGRCGSTLLSRMLAENRLGIRKGIMFHQFCHSYAATLGDLVPMLLPVSQSTTLL